MVPTPREDTEPFAQSTENVTSAVPDSDGRTSSANAAHWSAAGLSDRQLPARAVIAADVSGASGDTDADPHPHISAPATISTAPKRIWTLTRYAFFLAAASLSGHRRMFGRVRRGLVSS